jgi:uncharacterized protein YbgA (DUF1722 family)/uncharacterized protein YbbK (DUF523 family)
LGFEAVRYDGSIIRDEFVEAMRPHVQFVPVCPEVEIGLGIPRAPVRVVLQEGEKRLLQPTTGRDVTEAMARFTASFLEGLEAVDGFLLKSRSPSSGIKDVKIYPGPGPGAAVGKGAGFFGGEVINRFGHLAVEEEGRMKNARLREHFLTKLFAFASFRSAKGKGGMAELIQFHAENKTLLLSYHQTQLRALGRIVANPQKLPAAEVWNDYEAGFYPAFARPPRRPTTVNALEHAWGHFSEGVNQAEKDYFFRELEAYRAGRLPLAVPRGLLRGFALRFGDAYVASQTFFEPYPEELESLADSGKGRT